MGTDAVAARTVRPLGLGLAAFYAVLAAYAAARPDLPAALLPTWAGASAALSLHALLVGLRPPPSSHAHAHLLAQGLAVAAASTALLAIAREPSLAIALHLTAVGFGLVFLHAGAFAVLALACATGFALVAHPDFHAWSAQAFALGGSILVGAAALQVRRHTFREHAARVAAEQAAFRLESAAARMREEARFKSAFLSKAAHELQTPLTPLLLQARILQAQPPADPEERRQAEILVRNVERLGNVVQDFLAVQRLDAGLQPRPMPLDLAALAREAAAAARPAGPIDVQADAGPVPVRGDRDLLLLAFAKLLDNARKFAPAGSAVALSVRADGPQAVARVADTGPGVAPAARGRIFQPFEQAHDPMEHTRSGFGLGLTVVRLVAEAHGGGVAVGEGAGGVFELRLPLAQA